MTDLVEATTRAWNDRDRAAYRDCYAEDAEVIAPGSVGKGHEAILGLFDEIMASYPDNHITVDRVVTEGDTLVEESRVVGTNTGPLAGPDGTPIPATGRAVSLGLVGIHVVDGDRITSTHFYWDTYDMLGQLGLLDH